MKDQHAVVCAAIAGLLAMGAGAAHATETEKCFGVARAGQNACNSNVNKHSCAGHAKVDNDPKDFVPLPVGSCLKMGGRPETLTSSEKK